MSRWIRVLLWTLGLPLAIAAVVAGVFFVERASSDDEVARGVVLAGRDISGLGEADLDQELRVLQRELDAVPLVVTSAAFRLDLTHGEAGVSLDTEAIKQRAFAARRSGDLRDDFESWIESFQETVNIPLTYLFDPEPVSAMVEWHPDRIQLHPVEPWFTGEGQGWQVQNPIPGSYVEANVVVAALADAVAGAAPPFDVVVDPSVLPTKISQAELDVALADAQALAQRLTVTVNERPAFIGAESVRRWIDSVEDEQGLRAVFVPDRVEPAVERLLSDLATQPAEPVFEVVDGEVVVDIGEPAVRCCAPGITELLFDSAANGGHVVDLPTRLVEEDGGKARVEAIGIKELVSEFTTPHACCQSRVRNIQRMADLVRGQIIEPGERFSINEFIGPRTRANGFTSAGVIVQGHFKEAVGGGVSQFATTMFNTAFFAGLELDAYRSHSIYISRYPYGREATLNYPEIDLAVINTTPYSILLWTSYTSRSITVSMYSTKYYEVEQVRQTRGRAGACTRVNTYRERTAPDGTVREDSVTALYRPAEGIDCNGNKIPEPPD